jgi:hypothetical protein
MRTILLLTISNVFMTFAWYGHLKFRSETLWKVIMVSWGIAFFEYCFQVPANRIGSYEFNGAQLKTHSGSHHAFGLLCFLGPLSGRKIQVELCCGLCVHRARLLFRFPQLVRMCAPAIQARRSGRQTTTSCPREKWSNGFRGGNTIPAASAMVFPVNSTSATCKGHGE